jgi:hypothetical protein
MSFRLLAIKLILFSIEDLSKVVKTSGQASPETGIGIVTGLSASRRPAYQEGADRFGCPNWQAGRYNDSAKFGRLHVRRPKQLSGIRDGALRCRYGSEGIPSR